MRAHMATSSRSANGPCDEKVKPSAIRAADELSGCLNSTKRIEIVVAALGKSDKLLWRVRERKQALPESDRNREITLPVHDQQRRRDTCDTLIGVKPIPQQPAHRNEPKMRSGNVRYRCIGSFQDQLSNRIIAAHRPRAPPPHREAP